jgi:hypothetical protein
MIYSLVESLTDQVCLVDVTHASRSAETAAAAAAANSDQLRPGNHATMLSSMPVSRRNSRSLDVPPRGVKNPSSQRSNSFLHTASQRGWFATTQSGRQTTANDARTVRVSFAVILDPHAADAADYGFIDD